MRPDCPLSVAIIHHPSFNQERMKRRFSVILAIVLIGLLFVSTLTSWHQFPIKKTLPDGTVLTLVAIKIGDKHYSPFSGPIHHLATLLPAKLCSRLKLQRPDQVRETYGS